MGRRYVSRKTRAKISHGLKKHYSSSIHRQQHSKAIRAANYRKSGSYHHRTSQASMGCLVSMLEMLFIVLAIGVTLLFLF